MGKFHKPAMEILMIVLVTICLTCQDKKIISIETPEPFDGLWYYVDDDSIYHEIIFTDSSYLSYDHAIGFIYRSLSVHEDSVSFYYDTDLIGKSKFIKIDSNKISLQAYDMKSPTVYYRIIGGQASIKLVIHGNEEEIEKYRSEFIAREYELIYSKLK